MKLLNCEKMRFVLVGFLAAIVVGTGNVKADFTWTEKASMPTPRWNFATCVANGKIYALGGEKSEGDEEGLHSNMEAYDPISNTWIKKADAPVEMATFDASVVDGKIYAIGGDDSGSGVYMYDPITDTWTRKADMPTPRWFLATCAVNGKIYAIGGTRPGGTVGRKIVEQYDPVTDTWTRKTDMPVGLWGLCANVVNRKIYVLGGRKNYVAEPYVQEYDPTTDTWTRKADMPVGTSQMASVVLADKVIVIGGWRWSNDFPYTTVQIFDPKNDTWTSEASLPFERAAFSAEVVNNTIYVIGGTDRPHPCPATSTVYELGPLVDFNGDEIVDIADMRIMIDNWGDNYSLCDIGPTPIGDGIVDVQDFIILAEHIEPEVRDPTLIAHWKLNEEAGNTAYESIGSYDSILRGEPLWQPDGGKVSGALQFDGIDDYVETPFVRSPADGSLSVFAWIKGATPGQVIISQIDGTPGLGGSAWLCIEPSEGRLITKLMHPPFSPLESESVIADGLWHHVGVVYDFDGLYRCLYLDGVEVAKDISPIGAVGTDAGLYIGAGQDLNASTFFSGLIDDVRIYNVALTAEEIATLAQ